MSKIFSLMLLLGSFAALAQYEVLSPLGSRAELMPSEPMQTRNSGNTIDGLFIYNLDTLTLPSPSGFFDDFYKNHFQKYDAQPGDPDVTSIVYHALLELDNSPYPENTVFTTVPSYRINITLQPVITRDTIWFDAVLVQFNNLQNYPVVYQNINVYPAYFLIDTTDLNKPAPDTIWISSNLRQQHQAEVYFVDVNEPDSWWADNNAHWNYTRAHLPWSLGVATFDGLKSNGYPYAINTNQAGYADYLTSKSFFMDFTPADSVFLSFAYQPEGFGDRPEANDSLVLDFYNVTDQKWETVWKVSGAPLHEFKLVYVHVGDVKFLQDGFKFRFKNYGGLSGDLDNWHIDYVRLKPNWSTAIDTIILDFAMVYPIPTLLKEYTSVPWEHYVNNPTGHMTDSLLITLRNSNAIAGNTSNGNLRVFDNGILNNDYVFPGGTLTTDLNYEPRTTYTTQHSLVAISPFYNFPVSDPNAENYTFDYYFRAAAPFAQLSNDNDTIHGQQYFANYYAYDDGSAELAYGVTGEQSRLAYQFTTFEPDSLVAVQMHFVPTVFDHSDKLFLLTVWADNNGQPGQVIYQDDFFTAQNPVYIPEKNSFWHYYFKDNMKVGVSGTFYVGWRQIDPQRLNVGFDKNTNTQNKIFYSVDLGATWQNSSFEGSLMIRPVFSTAMDVYLGEEEITITEDLVVYPNPATTALNFSFVHEGVVEIIASDGKVIRAEAWTSQINLSDLTTGFYFIRVTSADGQYQRTFKIIKSS